MLPRPTFGDTCRAMSVCSFDCCFSLYSVVKATERVFLTNYVTSPLFKASLLI